MATRIVRGVNKGSGNLTARESVKDVPETPAKAAEYGFKTDRAYFGVNDPKNIKAAERVNKLSGNGANVVTARGKFTGRG
jgi:hypothetical protein